MKILYLLLLNLLYILKVDAQVPFLLTFEQDEVDYISDVANANGHYFFIQNRLINISQGFADSYSDMLIVDETGSLIDKINLNGFKTNYSRIIKIEDNNIYLIGVVESDSCKSRLVFSKFNIDTKNLEHITSHDFCDRILVNIKIAHGLNEKEFFLDEYHYINNSFLKNIYIVDTSYNLTLIFDSLYWAETVSVDFSRKGYVKATIGLYDFYDSNFNFRKQRSTSEGFLPIQETHKPFGNAFILEQGVQHIYSEPNYGLQVRLIDSNLIIKKKVILLPNDSNFSNIEMPFYGGIDIQNENEVWAAGVFGHFDSPPVRPYYYSVSKLDSNLNVICQHFLGYDTRYRLFGIRAFEIGGAIVFGQKLRAEHIVNEGEDIFAIRVGENCELPTVSTSDPNNRLVSISAYPNPTINSLTFEVNGFDPSSLKVEIIDVEGTILFSKKDLSYEIKVADMPPGQYFYRILEGEKILGVGAWVKQ